MPARQRAPVASARRLPPDVAGPKLEPVALTAQERQVLEGWARRRMTAQPLALRSRIVLACPNHRVGQPGLSDH